jgi:DNA-binding MarR family transcriptional regulator
MTAERTSSGGRTTPEVTGDDVVLERALEGLFRLGANKRFDAAQAAAVGEAVTRAGYAVLRCLSDAGSLSIRAVADACAMDAATASRQVSQLVETGLVERRTADGDARTAELSLTRRGRDVYERVVAYRHAHLAGAVAGWSRRDRATLARLATRLTADLRAARPPDVQLAPSRAQRSAG